MASTLLRANGSIENIEPRNGKHWQLEELQDLVGGYIEVARTLSGTWLVIDEEGKLKNKPLNVSATRIYQYGSHDPIVGDAVLVTTFFELNGPDDEE
jgi:hypothetical protein